MTRNTRNTRSLQAPLTCRTLQATPPAVLQVSNPKEDIVTLADLSASVDGILWSQTPSLAIAAPPTPSFNLHVVDKVGLAGRHISSDNSRDGCFLGLGSLDNSKAGGFLEVGTEKLCSLVLKND